MDAGNKRGEMDLRFFHHASSLTVSKHNAQSMVPHKGRHDKNGLEIFDPTRPEKYMIWIWFFLLEVEMSWPVI